MVQRSEIYRVYIKTKMNQFPLVLGCFMGVILYGVSFMFKEASRCMVVSRVN